MLVNEVNNILVTLNYVFNGLKLPKSNYSGGSMNIDYDKDDRNKGTFTFKLKKKDFGNDINNRNIITEEELDSIKHNWKSMTVDNRIVFDSIVLDKTNIIIRFSFNYN